jgi:hypothetical protein
MIFESPDQPLQLPPHLIGASLCVAAAVSGPQHFCDISLKVFSAYDAECIRQWLSDGAESVPDFPIAWGRGNRGLLTLRSVAAIS